MKNFIVDILALLTDKLIDLIEFIDPDYLDNYGYEEDQPKVTKIWGVVDGPYNREDFPEEEIANMDIPENAMAMVVAKVEDADGKVGTVNLWVGSFNEAYEICKHFDESIEPLVLEA